MSIRLNIQITGACDNNCGLDNINYLGLCGTTTTPGGGDGGTGTGTSPDPEIIFIVDEDNKVVTWTPTRKAKYGVFPIIQCWLRDDNGTNYLTSQQPSIDVPPPNMTAITFVFTEPENGFIIISK